VIFQYWHSEQPPDYIEELVATVAERNPGEHRLFNRVTAEQLISDRFGPRELSAFRDCAVPSMNHSLRAGSSSPEKATRVAARSAGGGGWAPGCPRPSASMTSRHTGAAPLVPETARIGSPSRFPTHTATV